MSSIDSKRSSGLRESVRATADSTAGGRSGAWWRSDVGRLREDRRDGREQIALLGPRALAGEELVAHHAPRELIARGRPARRL